MSISGFHHHVKAVTAMSPLQFQKLLRLQEARRLLVAGDVDAATAGAISSVSSATASVAHAAMPRLGATPTSEAPGS